MPESRISPEIRNALIQKLDGDRVFWKKADLSPYVKDACNLLVDADYDYFPDLVVLPNSTADIVEIVKMAAEHKIPLIPKGGGSNRSGMLVPIHGGIIIDTIRMNRIIDLDVENLSVTVQPGVILKELDDFLAKKGFSLNQEQGSMKVATIGGSISTAAFSRKHQKYGTIANRVMSLEVVLADGKILRTGRKVLYTSTGYLLHQLFIGAEGTLGIITEATLRIEPRAEARDALMTFYDDFWAANEASKKLTASCVTFAGGEAQELDGAEELGAPQGKKGFLLILFEGTRGEVEAEVTFVKNIIQETGGILGDRDKARSLIDGYSLIWCGTRATTDCYYDEINPYIPADRIREFYDRLWNDIMPKYGIQPIPGEKYETDVGRFSMAYSQFKIPSDDRSREKFERARREIAELVTELGGSISSCIGVGLKNIKNMDLEFSETALNVMRRIKEEFDPDNIMNPGKKLPPSKAA